MKHVQIVGLGMSADTLTAEGRRALEQADALFGAPRLLEPFAGLGKPAYGEFAPEAVARTLDGLESGRFCVLVSGDTGFFSAAESLCTALESLLADCTLTVIPGVSSLSFFFSRLRRPWQDAALVSCHGRRVNLVDTVRRSRLTFALTGGNLAELGKELTAAGFGPLTAQVGENLGLPDERIRTLPVSGLADAKFASLAVLLVENPDPDTRVRCGIPDEAFTRGDVPMTKSEVRAVTLSKLALAPEAVCCDIGAGTGSVTVEMALAAYKGHVYALDKNAAALPLVAANCRAFHIGNVTPLPGSAPEALAGLPALDAAFIGGSSGRLGDIFAALLPKNPNIRIVVNAVTLETLHEATEAFAAYGLDPDIVEISAARARTVGSRRMLQAASPVFILSGGGRPESGADRHDRRPESGGADAENAESGGGRGKWRRPWIDS